MRLAHSRALARSRILPALAVLVAMCDLLVGCARSPSNCRVDTGPMGSSVRLCLAVPAGPSDPARVAVTATVQVTGAAPAVNGVTFWLDGSYLLFVEQDPYTFLLHA